MKRDGDSARNFELERSTDVQPAGNDAELADPETGGSAHEPQRVLAGQASPRRRWPTLCQIGRRSPLRGDLPPAMDEGPAAHLDQRVLRTDSKILRARGGNTLTPSSF
jgi:hypothetical protein